MSATAYNVMSWNGSVRLTAPAGAGTIYRGMPAILAIIIQPSRAAKYGGARTDLGLVVVPAPVHVLQKSASAAVTRDRALHTIERPARKGSECSGPTGPDKSGGACYVNCWGPPPLEPGRWGCGSDTPLRASRRAQGLRARRAWLPTNYLYPWTLFGALNSGFGDISIAGGAGGAVTGPR